MDFEKKYRDEYRAKWHKKMSVDIGENEYDGRE